MLTRHERNASFLFLELRRDQMVPAFAGPRDTFLASLYFPWRCFISPDCHRPVLRYDAAMSEAKPKRKFWQLHLSTAVLMMLFSGALLFANLSTYKGELRPCYGAVGNPVYTADGIPLRRISDIPTFYTQTYCRGWPFNYWKVELDTGDSHYRFVSGSDNPRYFYRNVGLDCILGVMLLAAATFTLEFLIRRREARKT
jgi:hypothetical protein